MIFFTGHRDSVSMYVGEQGIKRQDYKYVTEANQLQGLKPHTLILVLVKNAPIANWIYALQDFAKLRGWLVLEVEI
jgi:hypothetical protein